MGKLENEFREYKVKGFPDEIAAAKALAHSLAPSTPGVWRVILQAVSEAEAVRENIIAWTPDGFEEEVRELLACARTIKEMHQGILHCGWFYVEYEGQGWYVVHSSNHSLPECVGEEEYEQIEDDGYAQVFKFKVKSLALLRSNGWEEAEFEWVGLFYDSDAWLLEIRRSKRGLRAIEAIEEKIE